MTLLETLQQAKSQKKALGHFNFATIDMLHAIVRAAETVGVPVIVGVSEGERDFFGVQETVAVVTAIKKKASIPVFLNADHTFSFERVKEVIDAGFDSVIVDAAQLPTEENIALSRKCVEYARQSGKDVLVEAELGYIGQSSALLDSVPEGAIFDKSMLSSSEEVIHFVQQTGVDLFAPAVGNMHGTLKNAEDPHLHIDHVQKLSAAVSVPLVLHGGSGHTDQDLADAVEAGISQVHISTDLRVAYKTALTDAINGTDISPYKYLNPASAAVQQIVEKFLKLFSRQVN